MKKKTEIINIHRDWKKIIVRQLLNVRDIIKNYISLVNYLNEKKKNLIKEAV